MASRCECEVNVIFAGRSAEAQKLAATASTNEFGATLCDELLVCQDSERVPSTSVYLAQPRKRSTHRMLDATSAVQVKGETGLTADNHRNKRSAERILSGSEPWPPKLFGTGAAALRGICSSISNDALRTRVGQRLEYTTGGRNPGQSDVPVCGEDRRSSRSQSQRPACEGDGCLALARGLATHRDAGDRPFDNSVPRIGNCPIRSKLLQLGA